MYTVNYIDTDVGALGVEDISHWYGITTVAMYVMRIVCEPVLGGVSVGIWVGQLWTWRCERSRFLFE